MRISFIVPAYNVDEFIVKCIDSLIVQNLNTNEFEIIIINDASTDNTKHKIDYILEKYFQYSIEIINNEINLGLGSSRNIGMKHAKGDYIWFVDSDDFLENNSVSKLLTYAESKDLDILWFDHQLVDEKGQILPLPCEDIKKVPNNVLCEGDEFLYKYFGKSCMVWMFLFKTKFLKETKVSFYNNIYFEDILFTISIFSNAKRVSYINELGYNYLIRTKGSIMRDSSKIEKRILDGLFVALELSKMKSNDFTDKYIRDFSSMIIIYNIRQSSKISKEFYRKCYDFCRDEKILPVNVTQPISTKIICKIFNLFGEKFYYLAKFLK